MKIYLKIFFQKFFNNRLILFPKEQIHKHKFLKKKIMIMGALMYKKKLIKKIKIIYKIIYFLIMKNLLKIKFNLNINNKVISNTKKKNFLVTIGKVM